MEMDGRQLFVHHGCATAAPNGYPITSPTNSPSAPTGAGTFRGFASPIAVFATSYLEGASPTMSVALGFFLFRGFLLVDGGGSRFCDDYMEIEIHGPMMDPNAEEIAALEAAIASLQDMVESLQAQLNGTLTKMDVDMTVYEALAAHQAFDDFVAATPAVDQTVARISKNGQAKRFDVAGVPIFNISNPEPRFHLGNAGGDSLLRDMQGDVFRLEPTRRDVDVTSLRGMIIEGRADLEYDEESERWSWNNVVRQSYGKTTWHWTKRVEALKAKFDAAGVVYDSFSLDEANALWSFNASSLNFDCASPQIGVMMAEEPWVQLQECEYCFQNSKWKMWYPKNIPRKDYRYKQFCMKEMGKCFLNDVVWSTYYVIIATPSNAGGRYDLPGGSFEQWLRTAKTFLMDYYEPLPCATQQGDSVEGAYTVLTAKPFEAYKNFAIGARTQPIWHYPNDEAALTNITRCSFGFYEGFNEMLACVPGDSRQHLPEEWGKEPYIGPYSV